MDGKLIRTITQSFKTFFKWLYNNDMKLTMTNGKLKSVKE